MCGDQKQRHLRVPLIRSSGERPDAGRPGWAGGPLSTRPLQLGSCHCPRGGILGRSRDRAGGRGKEAGWGSGVWVAPLRLGAPAVLAREGTQTSGREPRRGPGSAAPAAPDSSGTLVAPAPPAQGEPLLAARPLPTPIFPFPDLGSSNHRCSGKGHSLADGHLGARPGLGIKEPGTNIPALSKVPVLF